MQQLAIYLNCGSLFFVDTVGSNINRIFTVNENNQEIDWNLGVFCSSEVYSIRKAISLLNAN